MYIYIYIHLRRLARLDRHPDPIPMKMASRYKASRLLDSRLSQLIAPRYLSSSSRNLDSEDVEMVEQKVRYFRTSKISFGTGG